MAASRVTFLLALGLAVAPLATARADSVLLVSGGEIKGEIADETSDTVIVRTGSGSITIPRKLVKKVVRESEAATLLAEARSLARNQDRKALDLFDRAIALLRKQGDLQGAQDAARERVKLATRLDHLAGPGIVPLEEPSALAVEGNPFLLARDLEEVQLQVQAKREGDANAGTRGAAKLQDLALRHVADHQARWAVGCYALAGELDPRDAKALYEAEATARRLACGAAIRVRDGQLALAAIAPLAKADPRDPRVAYLEARALEVLDRRGDANLAYHRALEGVSVPDVDLLPNDLLRELTRMLLQGEPPKEGSPGFGPSWTRVESDHFSVYHQLGDLFRDDEVRFFEAARDQALVRLEIAESEVAKTGRLPLFLFKDQASYAAGGGPEWAGGHTRRAALDDGVSYRICTFPGRRQSDAATIPHELAHVFVHEAFPELEIPAWANEGAATYAEPDAFRAQRRAAAARLVELGSWKPLGELFGRVTGAGEDPDAIRAFYAEASVAFELLVETTGSVKAALKLAARMGRKGAAPALEELGLTADGLDAQLRAKLSGK